MKDASKFIAVREMEISDIDLLANYWYESSHEHLKSMGADKNLLPAYKDFCKMLKTQIQYPYQKKQAYALIWMFKGEAIGHCNVNQIVFERKAYMHLHLWESKSRKRGMGTALVKQSLPYFFENLKLEELFCEPFALNHAPNNLLKSMGFTYLKEHITKPGNINYIQPVKLWVLKKAQYLERMV
ncbi:GNAT family N-acetyltransferase [Ascidiimonas sp. W6]|uniref:GNAT family N-acetyltransferase n=1 Tax=Ascidiimonas meishanensis TaxID=3128903 RepID=UPI0030ED4301